MTAKPITISITATKAEFGLLRYWLQKSAKSFDTDGTEKDVSDEMRLAWKTNADFLRKIAASLPGPY